MSNKLELLPAIDIRAGKAVRLLQGVSGSETDYGSPVKAATEWAQAGAEWIHLVDLDAAFGTGENSSAVSEVIAAAAGIKIELSGGIRDDQSLERALALGVTRVNLGTAVLENPEWAAKVIAAHGDKIAVGLDVRGDTLATRGWTADGGNLWQTLETLEAAGCCRYVVTDVTKDGTMRGPNLSLLQQIVEKTGKPVVASGGIATLDDISALKSLVPLGVEGAIIGKALYSSSFTLQEALNIAG